MSLFQAKSLTVHIGQKQICKDFNFNLKHGESWGILGRNGIGKTTLLHVFAGLRHADSGELFIEEQLLNSLKRKVIAKKIGVLLQDSHDTFPSTVIETVMTGRYPHVPFWGIESGRDIAISNQALVDVSLETMSGRQIDTLSGGERRRLALATLIVQNPLLWLLDEPANHLDLHHQIILLQLMKHRAIKSGGALMMVLHDVNLLSRFCSHAMLIIDHENIICGHVNDVLNQENLESLYQHGVRVVSSGDHNYFFPD